MFGHFSTLCNKGLKIRGDTGVRVNIIAGLISHRFEQMLTQCKT